MKKQFVRALAAALACIFAGCSAVLPASSGTEASSLPAPSQTPAPTVSASGSALRVLERGDENGCYTVCSEGEDAPSLLGYADYDELTAGPLCSRADCPHTDSDCTAVFASDEVPQDVWVLDNDRILIYVVGYSDGMSENRALYLAQRDGSGRRLLCRMEKDVSFSLDDPLIADGEFIYAVCGFASGANVLCRISLENGRLEPLYPLAYLQRILGVVDGRVVSLVYDLDAIEGFSQEPAPMEGITDSSAWKKPEEVSGNRWLRLLDVYGDNHGCLLQWQADSVQQERCFAISGSRVWWLDSLGAVGFAEADGSSGTLEVQWPQEVLQPGESNTFEDTLQILQGHLVITHLYSEALDKPPLYTRYTVDLSSGEVHEIPLYYVYNGLRMPIETAAGNSRALFVHIFTEAQDTNEVGIYGIPVQSQTVSHRYGMISHEDFLAGRPQYREFACSYILRAFE